MNAKKLSVKLFLLWLCVLLCLPAAGCRRTSQTGTQLSSSDGSNYSSSQNTPSGYASSTVSDNTSSEQETPDNTQSQQSPQSSEPSAPPEPAVPSVPEPTIYTPVNYPTVKACWISQFDLQDVLLDGGVQRDRADFSAKISVMLGSLHNYGFNTVMVQVRPYADSFYPSALCPWSDLVTGSFGTAAAYDPFAVILEKAHALGFSVHAWINPLRAMKTEQIVLVDPSYQIRKWYDTAAGSRVVELSGRWYLNPAYEDVRSLVAAGAAEIVKNYNVDGVHIDDYFYPTSDTAFDSTAFSEYKAAGGTLSLADFRTANITAVVKGIYNAVKAENPDALFGVSPDGDISRNESVHYADVKKWCSETGFIDYICPQIYYGLEHETLPFAATVKKWSTLVKESGVKLLAGMTLGKAKIGCDAYCTTDRAKYEWTNNKDVISRCMQSLSGLEGCCGVSVFCYQYMFDPVTGVTVPETAKEVENFLPVLAAMSF